MAIPIKNDAEIGKMRTAGHIARQAFEMAEKLVKPGVTTKELDKTVLEFLRSKNAKPSFLNYNGFPGNICVSVNDEVIHGIPGVRKLVCGDIVSIDIGAYIDGFHGDCARTYAVGEVSPEARRLIDITKRSFFEGIRYARQNCRLHQISDTVQKFVEANGFSVVKEYVGHGIGRELHEDPIVPNYKPPSRGAKLYKGMALAIEPMVNAGIDEVEILSNKWTVVTKDGSLSAHYENTVLITDGEPEILTLL